MNDETLKNELLNDVPEAGPHYWNRIDAALKQIEITEDYSSVDPTAPIANPEIQLDPEPANVQAQPITQVQPVPQSEPLQSTNSNVAVTQTNNSKFRKAMFGTAAGFVLLAGAAFAFNNLSTNNESVAISASSDEDSAAESFSATSNNQLENQTLNDEAVETGAESKATSQVTDAADSAADDAAEETSEPIEEDFNLEKFEWFNEYSSRKSLTNNSEITFSSGSTIGSFNGVISPDEFSVYRFRAARDQQVVVIFSSENNEVFSIIYGPDGEKVSDSNVIAEFLLPEFGDYYIVAQSEVEDAEFEASVSIL